MKVSTCWGWRALVLLSLSSLISCTPPSGPETGSQTNWGRVCDSDDECDGLACICGACTEICDGEENACSAIPGATCMAPTNTGAISVCGGSTPPSPLCLVACQSDADCAGAAACVAGVCTPTRVSSIRVTVDAKTRFQELVGFGASLAYDEDTLARHPSKEALFDLFFAEAGFSVLRFRNRYEDGNDADLASTQEIVTAAEARLGRRPLLLATASSPPAFLKANGSRSCSSNPLTCTLVQREDGSFDYEGFANHWRASLEAHARMGIAPDFINIQNHPNWLPGEPEGDACRFLPTEGTTSVEIDGAPVEVRYPGYLEALAAVRAAIADLPNRPGITAPETTGVQSLSEYAAALDPETFDVLALHLYGVNPTSVDPNAFQTVSELGRSYARPVFQTETRTGGMETALLVHHATTRAGASVYLQNDLVSPRDQEGHALVRLTDEAFEVQGPFHALAHFAKHTGPGWVRIGADNDSSELLSSAWLSPDERSVSVVLVNPTEEDLQAELALGAALRSSHVTRTVFDGVERSASLGPLPAARLVRVPARSIATITFSRN